MKPFKVGDKVFDIRYGVGKISHQEASETYTNHDINHVINRVIFESSADYYLLDGRDSFRAIAPSLFHLDEAREKFPWCFPKEPEKPKVLPDHFKEIIGLKTCYKCEHSEPWNDNFCSVHDIKIWDEAYDHVCDDFEPEK